MRTRNPYLGLIRTVAAALLLALATPFAGAQLAYDRSAGADSAEGATEPDFYREVARFDFDERARGNYEDTPMHWVQLEGPGLPTLFARGAFDHQIGHAAPPSFRLDIQTRNVAYEYQHLDLTVVPHSDYLVTAYVRAGGLTHASAFLAAYFVDRFGEPVPGSQRISKLIKATGVDPEPWQPVEIRIPGAFPEAYALRLQTWILQDRLWRELDPRELDPITRQDVFATAWFDDVEVFILPRVELRLSNPAGLILPDSAEEFLVEVNNATSETLRAELSIADARGAVLDHRRLLVPASDGPGAAEFKTRARPTQRARRGGAVLAADIQDGAPILRSPVPTLPPGQYSATLRVMGESEALLERAVTFTVLPQLDVKGRRTPDNGVDIGRWRSGDIQGLRELLDELSCGSVKVGIPMLGAMDTQEKADYFDDLQNLLRMLAENRVDTAGVLLPPLLDGDVTISRTVRQLIGKEDNWRVFLNPVLAQFGALLPTWQLGDEATELKGGNGWEPDEIERVRGQLRRFISIPRLAVPYSFSAVEPAGEDLASVWIPHGVPTRMLPRQLDFLAEADPSAYWLQLESGSRGGLNPQQRAADVARRIVLAKALNPGRVYVEAPFEMSDVGGKRVWRPTDDYILVRTLYHYLGGMAAVAATIPAEDVLAIVFEGVDSSCMVIWSWRDDPKPRTVDLYLGPSPHAVTIWGESVSLETRNRRTLLPVGPTPLIVVDLQAPLARLQASYMVTHTSIEAHDPDSGPILTFQNPYRSRLTGELRLSSPGDWQVEPESRPFDLAPEEVFTQPISLGIPPRQLSRAHKLDVAIALHSPENTELNFQEPLTIGLRGLDLVSSAHWVGDNLVVEQLLRNMSDEPVSFNAWCEPPGWARQEGEFLNIGLGESVVQGYEFPNARDLMGVHIPTGIEEINGKRSLIQFAEAPR